MELARPEYRYCPISPWKPGTDRTTLSVWPASSAELLPSIVVSSPRAEQGFWPVTAHSTLLRAGTSLGDLLRLSALEKLACHSRLPVHCQSGFQSRPRPDPGARRAACLGVLKDSGGSVCGGAPSVGMCRARSRNSRAISGRQTTAISVGPVSGGERLAPPPDTRHSTLAHP